MITNFDLFSFEHILSLLIAVILGLIFIFLAKKFSNKKNLISIIFAITIILIRCVRYGFDIYYYDFKWEYLISFHICHINLVLLVICLFKPNQKLFTFTFLLGIPPALGVAILPGKIFADPGLLRAIFFIISHTLLVMGSLYLLIIYKFKITKKDLYNSYILSIIIMVLAYVYNIIMSRNYMYLMGGEEGTVLEVIYNYTGQFLYIVILYITLVLLTTLIYLIYKLTIKIKLKTYTNYKENYCE